MRVFSNESALPIRWPKYWNFSFSTRPSNEYSGLILLGLIGLISLLFGKWILILVVLLGLEGAVDTRQGERRCEADVNSVKTGTVGHLPPLDPQCLVQEFIKHCMNE